MVNLLHAVFVSLFIILDTVICELRIPISTYDTESVRGVLSRLPSWINEEFAEIEVVSTAGNGNLLPTEGGAQIQFETTGRKVVFAKTPTDALYAINNYLRTECLTQISWSNSSFGAGCRKRKQFDRSPLNFKSKQVRYFGNMCTFSYSFAWWQWSDWERFIDWLALNGFNSVLLPLGQEAIWRDVFVELGVPRESLDSYFTSQAYLAWHRMGNLKGYGGGLSDIQMISDLNLAKKIVARLVELGIVPILPTFAGFVPDEMQKLFPKSKFNRLPCWNNFSSDNSCLLSVLPSDPLFSDIAKLFLQKQRKAFGEVSHLYSADPFNEMSPTGSSKFDPNFLKQTAQAILGSCRSFDKDCIWVLQSWAFSYDEWPTWAVKSFLSAVPVGQLMVLDLYAEVRPSWIETNSFYGHYFVWCLLHNFGGTMEIRGNLKQINKGYQLALVNSAENLVGGGLTMEAIDQNYVVYQFMIDRMWTDDMILMNKWTQSYAESRYSTDSKIAHKFWTLLTQTFYNQPEIATEPRFSVFLYHRPGFGNKIEYWFPVEKTFAMLKTMIPILDQVAGDVSHAKQDVSDVLRSIIQFEIGNDAVLSINEAYLLEDKSQIEASCGVLMQMFEKLDSLAYRSLNQWTGAAKSVAQTIEERKKFAISAKDLITVWGANGENMDYAHREWSGLTSDYYSKRWNFFCEWILEKDTFNRTEFNLNIFKYVEKRFLIA